MADPKDVPITQLPRHIQQAAVVPVQPRTRGAVHLSAKRGDQGSVIDDLRQSGALRALFPRGNNMLQAILINTSGGITGGDRLDLTADVGKNAALGLTTQAAERAYRSRDGVHGHVTSRINVAKNATLHWMPQELILFDGCALTRRLSIDLAPSSRLLMAEPVIFGRAAMGERLTNANFHDRISVTRAGQPLYRDAMRLSGNISSHLCNRAVANGAHAMASLLYVAPDAEAHLPRIRALLPQTGGASLLQPDTLALRLLASDSFALRAHLLPILDLLSANTLPASWRL